MKCYLASEPTALYIIIIIRLLEKMKLLNCKYLIGKTIIFWSQDKDYISTAEIMGNYRQKNLGNHRYFEHHNKLKNLGALNIKKLKIARSFKWTMCTVESII